MSKKDVRKNIGNTSNKYTPIDLLNKFNRRQRDTNKANRANKPNKINIEKLNTSK